MVLLAVLLCLMSNDLNFIDQQYIFGSKRKMLILLRPPSHYEGESPLLLSERG